MKTRVLIVDDEPIARRGIRRYLAKHNDIEVVGEAANGISAVEQINELHPDIVFLDVQMPDLDGFGVIENVEPSTCPAPVYIFVTAHDAHAAYLRRPPIAPRRITQITDRVVRFNTKDKKLGPITTEYSLADFVQKLADQVPDDYRHQPRYFGLLAPNTQARTSAAVLLGRKNVHVRKAHPGAA